MERLLLELCVGILNYWCQLPNCQPDGCLVKTVLSLFVDTENKHGLRDTVQLYSQAARAPPRTVISGTIDPLPISPTIQPRQSGPESVNMFVCVPRRARAAGPARKYPPRTHRPRPAPHARPPPARPGRDARD